MEQKTIDRIQMMLPVLNEKQKRLYLASEALEIGRGGIAQVSRASGTARSVIAAGIKDLRDCDVKVISVDAPIRRKGAGRKPITETPPGIEEALDKLVGDDTFGNPENPLRWTTKSLRKLAEELCEQGFKIAYRKVGYLLQKMGYSLQMNQKMNQVGKEPPDRNKQFEYINEKVKDFHSAGLPAISVDCKKKELVGSFKNVGAEYAPVKEPNKVLDHDFRCLTWERLLHTVFMTLPQTKDSSMWASVQIPHSLQSPQYAIGGYPWERSAILTRTNY